MDRSLPSTRLQVDKSEAAFRLDACEKTTLIGSYPDYPPALGTVGSSVCHLTALKESNGCVIVDRNWAVADNGPTVECWMTIRRWKKDTMYWQYPETCLT